ncbi:biopolymer transporter ExbD [Candidatus Poribacteria bacterium]|nr:biopolymer transporter ExbD [Candidatus Poribacteria bacterium]
MRVKSKKASGELPELQMGPMVDCVFLLLIFFMVSNVLRVPPPFRVDLPESKARAEFARKKFNIYVNAIGQISVDDKRIADLDSLENFLGLNQRNIETLIIRADKNAFHGIVVDIMERAKRRGIDNIAIAVNEGEYTRAL